LSAEPDQNQAVDIPLPALQICGLKDGQLIEPADYHRRERSSAVAESFETLHGRWTAFKMEEEDQQWVSPSPPEKSGEAKMAI
jgi:hypothetical protein